MHSSESSSGGSGMVEWSERYNPESPLLLPSPPSVSRAATSTRFGLLQRSIPRSLQSLPVVQLLSIVAKCRSTSCQTRDAIIDRNRYELRRTPLLANLNFGECPKG